ncbi:MAG: hypothetical protein Q4P23_05665 [Micrococcaceae bacterium]|nr:hypothetical protein [Micrococcaceae bacterium]
MIDERDVAGKALYESRLKFLTGLMMPGAPRWEDLPEDEKDRWRSNAA